MENLIPMMSPTIGEITKALSNFQGAVKQPSFNKKVRVNQSYNFEYADLGACVAAAAPVLKQNGLAVTQTIQGGVLVTTLLHTSGEFINSIMPYDLSRFTKMQDFGSALTYAKRYSYCAILGLVADADDDANMADGNTAQFQGQGQQARPQQAPVPQPRAGVTGAQLKGYINDINSKTNIEEMLDAAKQIPDIIKKNKTFQESVFQKASSLGIAELEHCSAVEEIETLVDRWTEIWPAVIASKTPFGNAIETKLNKIKEETK